MASPRKTINPAKLTERSASPVPRLARGRRRSPALTRTPRHPPASAVAVIVEQPSFQAGAGGLASTDPASFAMSRAALVLAAVQVYPLMVKHAALARVRITVLSESDPMKFITGVADGSNVRVEPAAAPAGAPADAVYVRVHIPTRSHVAAKLLEAGDVRRSLLRALAVAGGLAVGDAPLARAADALERAWTADFKQRVPLDIVHLKLMGVLPPDWVEAHARATGLDKAAGAATVARAEHATGSAVGLWWPVTPHALTFDEMLKQRAELKEALAETKAMQTHEDRETRARAAEARLAAAGGSPA